MPPDGFPITVAEWPRNARETIRVRLDMFNGRAVVDCRTWWRNELGELRPGKGGLTISARHLPALAESLKAALEHAHAAGLLAEETDSR